MPYVQKNTTYLDGVNQYLFLIENIASIGKEFTEFAIFITSSIFRAHLSARKILKNH